MEETHRTGPITWSYWNHEPIYHLRRMGNDGDTIFSLGEWVDEWYDRIHEEELIAKAAEAGINLVYTHYHKGFGLKYEQEEMERTRRFTQLAHKHDVKVLGYVSMGSLYLETYPDELPDVCDMLIRKKDGRTKPTLRNQYYRPRPCFNSDKFLAHMKDVIRYGVEHVGLDGFHFDNSLMLFCYCETCKEKFRQYLRDNLKNPYEIMGIRHFDYVSIPYYEHAQSGGVPVGNNHDVLLAWYYKFLQDTCYRFHKACFDYVKEVSGGKAFTLHNSGFPRTDSGYKNGACEPELTPDSCDFCFIENKGAAFGVEGGRIEGQIPGHKFAERFGYKVFDTSFFDSAGDRRAYRFPRDKQEISRFLMHNAVFGGIMGEPWTVRSTQNGGEVFFDRPYAYEGLKQAFCFFRENYAIFDSKSYSKVKVLHLPLNLSNADHGSSSAEWVNSALIRSNIPFSIVTAGDIASLQKGDTLVLPGIFYCAASLYDDIKKAADRGVMVLATEGFGYYNENTKPRAVRGEIYNLQGIENKKIISVEELADCIEKTVSVNVPDVVLETRLTADGRLALHVLNADNHRDLPEVEVTFEDEKLATCTKWEVFTPDDTQVSVALEGNKAVVKIQNYQTLVSVLFS